MKILETLENFKSHISLDCSDSTVMEYYYCMKRVIRVIGNLEVTEINHRTITDFISKINGFEPETGLDSGIVKIAGNTQYRLITTMRKYFNFLVEIEVLHESKNPMLFIESPKIKKIIPDVLSLDEVLSIFSYLESIRNKVKDKSFYLRNYAIVETLYSCGLRASEVANLHISGLFLENGYIKVTGKGDRERLVPIGESAIDRIKEYIPLRKPDEKSKDILFLSKNTSGYIARDVIFITVRQILMDAGITKKCHPHILRHSFATHLMENGADIRSIQEMLGHKVIQATEIYTHTSSEYNRKQLEMYHPGWSGKGMGKGVAGNQIFDNRKLIQ